MIQILLVGLVLFGVSVLTDANASSIDLPNLKRPATGTDLGGGKYALDVSLPPGAVVVEGGKDIGDASVVPGDKGLVVLGVRKDSAGALVNDGEYTPPLFDSNGSMKVVSTPSGSSVVTTVRNVYSLTNVTTGAWVELVSSTPSDINRLEIFDSSGQTMEIGIGALSSETRLLLVFPGGNGTVYVNIPSGTRISVRAVSGTANVGEIDINFYGQ